MAALEERPVGQFVHELLSFAVQERATDIHIEPSERGYWVRYRVDGVLRLTGLSLPFPVGRGVVASIKGMAEMDLAESRLPQDGRFSGAYDGVPLDVRVSTLPTPLGEKVVLRLLPKEAPMKELNQLGMEEDTLKAWTELLKSPSGLLLVVGPTGSGKTTTLYASLRKVATASVNVVTVEDPIEYRLPFVTQTQVHPEIGLTFATLLRHILRQDPDIIFIGEIRDEETASIAFRAALTGHLVFSTLHTQDAAEAITRLLDLGVERFLVSACLLGVLAQRLVRLVCPFCSEGVAPFDEEKSLVKAWMGKEPDESWKWLRGKGCQKCGFTSYRGRTGVFELLVFEKTVKEAFLEGASSLSLRKLAKGLGMRSLIEDALWKVKKGQTTVGEALRVVASLRVGALDGADTL